MRCKLDKPKCKRKAENEITLVCPRTGTNKCQLLPPGCPLKSKEDENPQLYNRMKKKNAFDCDRPVPCENCLGNLLQNPMFKKNCKRNKKCPFLTVIDISEEYCLCNDVPRIDTGPRCPFAQPACPCEAKVNCPFPSIPACTPCKQFCSKEKKKKGLVNQCALIAKSDKTSPSPPPPSPPLPPPTNCQCSQPLYSTSYQSGSQGNFSNACCSLQTGTHLDCPIDCPCEPPRTFHVPTCPIKNPDCLSHIPKATTKGAKVCPFFPQCCPLGPVCPFPVAAELCTPDKVLLNEIKLTPKITSDKSARIEIKKSNTDAELKKIDPVAEQKTTASILPKESVTSTNPPLPPCYPVPPCPPLLCPPLCKPRYPPCLPCSTSYCNCSCAPCPPPCTLSHPCCSCACYPCTSCLPICSPCKPCPLIKTERGCPFAPPPCPLDPIKPLVINKPKPCPCVCKPTCPLIPLPLCPATTKCLKSDTKPLPVCPYAPPCCPLAPKEDSVSEDTCCTNG